MTMKNTMIAHLLHSQWKRSHGGCPYYSQSRSQCSVIVNGGDDGGSTPIWSGITCAVAHSTTVSSERGDRSPQSWKWKQSSVFLSLFSQHQRREEYQHQPSILCRRRSVMMLWWSLVSSFIILEPWWPGPAPASQEEWQLTITPPWPLPHLTASGIRTRTIMIHPHTIMYHDVSVSVRRSIRWVSASGVTLMSMMSTTRSIMILPDHDHVCCM